MQLSKCHHHTCSNVEFDCLAFIQAHIMYDAFHIGLKFCVQLTLSVNQCFYVANPCIQLKLIDSTSCYNLINVHVCLSCLSFLWMIMANVNQPLVGAKMLVFK